jgi:hypothetical protein
MGELKAAVRGLEHGCLAIARPPAEPTTPTELEILFLRWAAGGAIAAELGAELLIAVLPRSYARINRSLRIPQKF